ncbi:flagellar basal-body rod modification protein FlgD [Halomonas campaniensis]|uniref:Basal-body rod modification protein FlgD n=1 Tax=Halomonas campaniensis TaxID=213554 RepID=A0A7W5K135_9GAMM|nr:flagellar hook assembly protein FlgD [Halomonas campaniensis]MBB3329905.1 flagellar basal-body rod modification protein FlgD [Halomonas campaniensis]
MTSPIGSNVLNTVNAGAPAGMASRQSDELRDNFMTLLITQLQNQDPLNPLENNELTSQLAQINTVSGIEQLNKTLDGITSQIGAGQTMQAAGLIGQGVLVPGDRVLLERDAEGQAHATPFGIELAESADNVRVTIVGGDGQVINRYDIGPVSAGVESFTWDGRTREGEGAIPGAYRVRIEALRGEEALSAETLNYAVVGGVTPPDGQGGVRLDLGAIYGQVGLDQVKQIL